MELYFEFKTTRNLSHPVQNIRAKIRINIVSVCQLNTKETGTTGRGGQIIKTELDIIHFSVLDFVH